MPRVGIIMGSDSDLKVMSKAAVMLEELGIDYEMTIISAHREPDELIEWTRSAEGRGMQMPPGVPVATVAIDGAKNAAILAAKILAASDDALLQKLKDYTTGQKEAVKAKAAKLDEVGYEAYLASK